MSPAAVTLHGFAYGEALDSISGRYLGFRLLAPAAPAPWTAEVESLARRLQSAPYPDHWPESELFCSVLLGDGQRLIALARYGLTDHTPSHRRGGVELIGVVGPEHIEPEAALAVYHWLRQRRTENPELRDFSGEFDCAQVLGSTTLPPAPSEPLPVLPVRLGQEGVLLFAATAPAEPDHHLGLLQRHAAPRWQWLPLVGVDFPLQTYAKRGPLIAWTPHLTGVALQLDRKLPDTDAPPPRTATRQNQWVLGLLTLLITLTVVNLVLSLLILRGQ
jgi:hypothetical protein